MILLNDAQKKLLNWLRLKSSNNLVRIELSQEKLANNSVLWHAIFRDLNGNAFAGGTDVATELAIDKCLMEACERVVLRYLRSEPNFSKFKFNNLTCTNGMAAGYDRAFAIRKSELEIAERLVWSKWVNRELQLTELDENNFSNSNDFFHFTKNFDEVKFFELPLILFGTSNQLNVNFFCALGILNEGVFWGTSIGTDITESFSHAMIEVNRNYLTWKYLLKYGNAQLPFVDRIILKFGNSGANFFLPAFAKKSLALEVCIRSTESINLVDNVWISRSVIDSSFEGLNSSELLPLLW